MNLPTRILLADDHAVLRSGLRLLLNGQDGLSVAGEAATGLETLQMAEALQPDLILLDLSMPQLDGMQAIPALRRLAPDAKILILTMHDDPQYARQALQRGASGYILKKAADTELVSAIRAVLRGEIYIYSAMTRVLLDSLLASSEDNAEHDLWATLSEREQEVLKKVALGYTSAEIGEQLSLSSKTIESYRARGMEKLGLRNRAALVRFALRRGLINPE